MIERAWLPQASAGASPTTLMKSAPPEVSIAPVMFVSVASLGADDVPSDGGEPHGLEIRQVCPSLTVAAVPGVSLNARLQTDGKPSPSDAVKLPLLFARLSVKSPPIVLDCPVISDPRELVHAA